MTNLWMRGLWVLCALWAWGQSAAYASEKWHEGVAEEATLPVSISTRGSWSPDGSWIAYNDRIQGGFALYRFTLEDKSRQEIGRSENSFFPTFGPLGLLFGGPAQDPPLALKHWYRKGVKSATKAKGEPAQTTKETEPSEDSPKNPSPGIRYTSGIVLFGKQHQNYLFPGWRPTYSEGARHLVYSFQGSLFMWNPLKDRRGGLLLLTKGFDPVWEPKGRAMTFLARSFQHFADGSVEGGGISLVDLRFRHVLLTSCGGEVAWSSDSSGLYLVASPACFRKIQQERQGTVKKARPRKRKKRKKKAISSLRGPASLIWLPLKPSRALPKLLVSGAKQPSCPPQSTKLYRDLVAYADAQGVWVLHRQNKKRFLIAPGAVAPRWSARGRLLVHYPKKLVVLRLRPRFLHSLSNP